ncbi:MAG: FecR domain-containing protein [Ginsengibacter sp.]
MDKHYFIKLFKKYQHGNLTFEEQQFLIKYFDLFQNEPDVMQTMDSEEKQNLKNSIQNSIWEHVLIDGSKKAPVRFMNRSFVKWAAASVAILIIISSIVYFSIDSKKPMEENNVVIQKQENRIIFLPDGSKVILSPGSRLNYPSSFDELTTREVYLVGQAYFDIKHNNTKPFIVHSGKVETIVLGTAFNIKAMEGESDITVTVTRGKVKVVDLEKKKVLGVLTRDQQITYCTVKTKLVTRTVDSEKLLDWKNQDLLCDNLTLAEAAELLGERYHVTINIDSELTRSQRFTATFPRNENLEQILKSICVFNGLEYQYDKEKSTIEIRNK